MKGVSKSVIVFGLSSFMGFSSALADAPIISALPTGSSGNTASLSLEQRLHLLENKVQYYERSDIVLEMQHLREQVQTLQGQLEEHAHTLQQLVKQQTEFYSDFDRRLAALNKTVPATNNGPAVASSVPVVNKTEPKSAAVSTSSTSANPASAPAVTLNENATLPSGSKVVESFSQPTAQQASTAPKQPEVSYLAPVATPGPANQSAKPAVSYVPPTQSQPAKAPALNEAQAQRSYDLAFRMIGQHKYSEAQQAMSDFITRYPQSRYVANAHYWLGELYLKNGERNEAQSHFQTIKVAFAQHPKAADARYKLGMLKKVDGDNKGAKEEFNGVIANNPGTAAAQLSSVQLRQLG